MLLLECINASRHLAQPNIGESSGNASTIFSRLWGKLSYLRFFTPVYSTLKDNNRALCPLYLSFFVFRFLLLYFLLLLSMINILCSVLLGLWFVLWFVLFAFYFIFYVLCFKCMFYVHIMRCMLYVVHRLLCAVCCIFACCIFYVSGEDENAFVFTRKARFPCRYDETGRYPVLSQTPQGIPGVVVWAFWGPVSCTGWNKPL